MADFMMAMSIIQSAKKSRDVLSQDISNSFDVFSQKDIKVHKLYATLGRYDFVAVFEAKDQAQAFKVASDINNLGVLDTETWPIIPYEDFTKLLS